MSLKPETLKAQQKLAAFCRDGKQVSIEGALDKRLPHYRRLVYNVMYGIVEKAFPITRSLLKEDDFKSMINAYLTEHDAQEEQVWKVPGEFCDFIASWDSEIHNTYPFLKDLMTMEWAEILVYNRENREIPPFEKGFSAKTGLVLNPDHEILQLRYPVFRGGWDKISEKVGEYRLLLFRHTQSDKVQFLEISMLHEALITELKKGLSVNKAIIQAAQQFALPTDVKTFGMLNNFLKSLQEKGFILGTPVAQ